MRRYWKLLNSLVPAFKDLGPLGLGTILSGIIQGIFIILVASILGVEDYGRISYFLAIGGISFAISSLGIGNTLLVYIPKKIKILSSISFLSLFFGIIGSFVIYFIFYDIGLSMLVIGFVIFDLATNELIARKLYWAFTKYVLIQKSLFVLLGLSLYFLYGPSGMILGFAISYLPSVIRIYGGLKETKINMAVIKPRLSFIMNNYVSQLSKLAYGYTDRLIIFPLFGFQLLGNYELGMQFLSLAYIFPMIIYRYTLPRDAEGKSTYKLKILTILISGVLTIITIFLVPIVLPQVFPQFTEAIELIPIMGLAIIPQTVVLMHISKFLGNEKSKIVMAGSLIHLSAQISGIIFLGNIYGGIGVATALVIAVLLEAGFLIVLNRLTFTKNQ